MLWCRLQSTMARSASAMISSIDAKELQAILNRIAGTMAAATERGRVADYIPELADVTNDRFGIAVVPVIGEALVAGDADVAFSIQSISKVFTLTLALEKFSGAIWERVGREPSGDPFNSIVQLELEHGVPRNPFINAGAIVIADLLVDGQTPQETVQEILTYCRELGNDEGIDIDQDVARSEERTGFRNVALASFMRAEGNIRAPVGHPLDVYFHHCAIAMSCRQLAAAGRYLAAAGDVHGDDARRVSMSCVRRINAVMMTCGHYDASGEFAFRVGLPGKSGVGGGILGIVPGVASIAAWSPGLNEKGSSVLASRAFEELAKATGWSVFGAPGRS